MKKIDIKLIGIIVGVIITIAVVGVFFVNSFSNRAIGLEEQITTAQSDIKVQEKARVDKVYNLADCVKQYNQHEAEVYKNIAASRNNGGRNIENITTMLSATVEAYPELKADSNYKNLMLELTTIENTLANYRKAYNTSVQKYNTYVKKFPNKSFLIFAGYEVNTYEKLDFNAPVDAPRDLFE